MSSILLLDNDDSTVELTAVMDVLQESGQVGNSSSYGNQRICRKEFNHKHENEKPDFIFNITLALSEQIVMSLTSVDSPHLSE